MIKFVCAQWHPCLHTVSCYYDNLVAVQRGVAEHVHYCVQGEREDLHTQAASDFMTVMILAQHLNWNLQSCLVSWPTAGFVFVGQSSTLCFLLGPVRYSSMWWGHDSKSHTSRHMVALRGMIHSILLKDCLPQSGGWKEHMQKLWIIWWCMWCMVFATPCNVTHTCIVKSQTTTATNNKYLELNKKKLLGTASGMPTSCTIGGRQRHAHLMSNYCFQDKPSSSALSLGLLWG